MSQSEGKERQNIDSNQTATKCSKDKDTDGNLVHKEIAKTRKRLHHEFRNMLTDEWALCRTAQAKSYALLKEMQEKGPPSDVSSDSDD